MQRRVLTAVFLLLAAFSARTEQQQISLRLWCELEPMVQEGEQYPLSADAARKRALEEARELLSAMIYGLQFSYTPGDRDRKITEAFTLAPIGEIPWGDPNLQVADAYVERDLLFVKVYYTLRDFQAARRRAWASNAIPLSRGSGSHSLFTAAPPEGKRLALKEALKEAVRNALRPVYYNKPREISGQLLLWSEPRTIIASGSYTTTVEAKLRIEEIRPYSLF